MIKLELTQEELAALVHACGIADDEGYITPGDTMHRVWRRLVDMEDTDTDTDGELAGYSPCPTCGAAAKYGSK